MGPQPDDWTQGGRFHCRLRRSHGSPALPPIRLSRKNTISADSSVATVRIAVLNSIFWCRFWEQRVDPADEFDELYWHETGFILRGVTDALTAIAWEKEHAAGRHSATFVLIPADPYPLIEDETLETSTSGTPPQRDQAIHIHSTIPDGRILNESNFFEFCMYADPEALES